MRKSFEESNIDRMLTNAFNVGELPPRDPDEMVASPSPDSPPTPPPAEPEKTAEAYREEQTVVAAAAKPPAEVPPRGRPARPRKAKESKRSDQIGKIKVQYSTFTFKTQDLSKLNIV